MGIFDNLFKTKVQQESERKRRMDRALSQMGQAVRAQQREIERRERSLLRLDERGLKAVRESNERRSAQLARQKVNEQAVIEKMHTALMGLERIEGKLRTVGNYEGFTSAVKSFDQVSQLLNQAESVEDMESTVHNVFEKLARQDAVFADLLTEPEEELGDSGAMSAEERAVKSQWEAQAMHGERKKGERITEDEGITSRDEEIDRLMDQTEKE